MEIRMASTKARKLQNNYPGPKVMKNSTLYAAKIAKLYRDMKKEHGKVKTVEYEDPIEAIVFGSLCEHLTLSSARSSMRKITKHFVDLNDLRVSRPEEFIEVLGGHSEEVDAVAFELSESLNGIFSKFDTVKLMELKELGKRQAKKELEDVEKVTPFAVGYCFLTALGGHAIPVSKLMADYLRVEGFVHPKAKEHDIEGFLERQNKSEDAYEFFMLLKAHSDASAKKTAKKVAKEEAKTAKKTKVKKTVKEKVSKEKNTVEEIEMKTEVVTEKKAKAKTKKTAVAKAVKKMAVEKVEKKTAEKPVKKTVKKAEKKAVKKVAKKAVKKTAKKTSKK